uniref:Coiled-coil domain-containing protein 22 homolog n=1 Tax=Hanusia phi TaxID=3032 RepID=A0A7S0EBG3_9CRYP
MSSRFRFCTELAESVKKSGFKGELGFHQFLYPSATSTRDLLSFLVDRLSKGGQNQGAGDLAGDGQILSRNIATSLRSAREAPRKLAVCRPRTLRGLHLRDQTWSYPCLRVSTSPLLDLPTSTASLSQASLKQISSPHSLAPSLFEANLILERRHKNEELELSVEEAKAKKAAFAKQVKEAIRLASANKPKHENDSLLALLEEWGGSKGPSKSTRFTRAADFGQEREQSILALDAELTREERKRAAEEERQARIQREEEERKEVETRLQEELEELTQQAERFAREAEIQSNNQRQLDIQIEEETNKTEELVAQYKLKKRTLALLANRDENVAQLRKVSEESAARLMELAVEWERHRLPLLEELRSKKSQLLQRQEDMKWKIERIKEMREEMKTLADQVRAKDEVVKSLMEEFKAMPKSVLRSAYIRRISELSKNMQKQKKDIRAILNDTREIQQEIAISSDILSRSYGAADDVVYREARDKGDASSKMMYKLLVSMHELFAELSSTVEKIGATQNEAREIELKIEQENARLNVLNMEQVVKDLEQIKTENQSMAKQLGQ